MGYNYYDQNSTGNNDKKKLIFPVLNALNFASYFSSNRATLRQREKYVLILVSLCFIIFCIGGFFFLPELKASKQFAYKHIQKVASFNQNEGLNPKFFNFVPMPPKSKDIDSQRIANKIDNDNAFIPKPNINQDYLKGSLMKPKLGVLKKDWIPEKLPSGEDKNPEINNRRETIKAMTKHAWDNYVKYAWGEDELSPITKKGHSSSIFGNSKMGATIIDSLDTLYIMGLTEEFNAARNFVINEFNVDSITSDVSVFEINIRFIGGLLSSYALTKDKAFLDKVEQLAQKLLPAFNTPSGIPHALVNLKSGKSYNYNWAPLSSSILAEFGTLHLEFLYLSHLTGDPIYLEKVQKIRNHLDKMLKFDGLYSNYIDPKTGKWPPSALGDSFYEYLLKSWVQSGQSDTQAKRMYDEAISAILTHLLKTSESGMMYFGEKNLPVFKPKMDHLACFSGGLIAYGANISMVLPEKKKYISIGANITNTCHESYIRTATKLGPENFHFTKRVEARGISPQDKIYIQRPEVIEGYFYMWRVTKNPIYREWAWHATQALISFCKVDGGFTGLKNVYDVNAPKDDVQQSFLLAETFKYLYLIFSDDSLIPMDKWVFNTEAHVLPIMNKNSAFIVD